MSNTEHDEASIRELEVLQGIRLDDSGLNVWVTSNGCTTIDNFRVDINWGITGETAMTVEIYRIKRDPCKMMPVTIQITFPWSSLNPRGKDITSFEVKNKVGKFRG